MDYKIQSAESEQSVVKCWDAIKVLRPHLEMQAYLKTVKQMMTEGYRLAYFEENGKAIAVIGFRYLQMLYNGKQIYIDDLVTLEGFRGKGLSGKLLDYVFSIAIEKGFNCVTLDSGPSRHDAHRLYLNKGFKISSYHFQAQLPHV